MRKFTTTAVAAGMALLLAGCAAADKSAPTAMAPTTTTSNPMSGMDMSSGGTTGGASDSGAASSQAVAAELKAAPTIDGIRAVPTQVVGTAVWQGMKITAQLMTPVPFVVFNGTSEHLFKVSKKTSFHLMVMLNDAETGVPIPYASVWATVRNASGHVVFDEQQWPMISRYMGPHYGNDVSLPGAGHYQLSLLVGPPETGRHLEYQNLWLQPHRVRMSFSWNPLR
jgi:Fe2+ transport protein